MSSKADINLKILLIGSAAVGKTSLVNKYVHGKFRKDYALTIGMEPYTKYDNLNGMEICYTIFDIAGEQQFSKLRRMFYRGARGSLVVFDLTRKHTFDEVAKWISDARKSTPEQEFILIGNKADLTNQRQVSKDDGMQLAKELDCIMYIETSAKTGNNVEDSFEKLGASVVSNMEG